MENNPVLCQLTLVTSKPIILPPVTQLQIYFNFASVGNLLQCENKPQVGCEEYLLTSSIETIFFTD